MPDRTPAEIEFINQKSRQLMVGLAECAVKNGYITGVVELGVEESYMAHMKAKGWLTKRAPLTLTATGWGIASGFLKR